MPDRRHPSAERPARRIGAVCCEGSEPTHSTLGVFRGDTLAAGERCLLAARQPRNFARIDSEGVGITNLGGIDVTAGNHLHYGASSRSLGLHRASGAISRARLRMQNWVVAETWTMLSPSSNELNFSTHVESKPGNLSWRSQLMTCSAYDEPTSCLQAASHPLSCI